MKDKPFLHSSVNFRCKKKDEKGYCRTCGHRISYLQAEHCGQCNHDFDLDRELNKEKK